MYTKYIISLILSVTSLGQASFLPQRNEIEITDFPEQQLGQSPYHVIEIDRENQALIDTQYDMQRAQREYDRYGRENVYGFYFDYTRTSIRNISQIFNFLSNKSQPLESIRLIFYNDKIQDVSGFQKLPSISSLSQFNLNLYNNPIDNSGLRNISNYISRQPHLKEVGLILAKTWITNFEDLYKGISRQSYAEKLTINLSKLVNQINGPFGFNVTLSKKLVDLYIDVSFNEVTGFQYVDNIVNQNPKNLQILNLQVTSNYYNDSNIMYFQKLAQLKTLRKLTLGIGNASGYYKRQLQKYLSDNIPGCDVRVGY